MTDPYPQIGAVLLSAGFSRRFGSDKRLAPLGASTVAETTAAIYAEAFVDHLRFVVRPEDKALQQKLSPLGDIIVTEQAHLGMGHSLTAGIQGLDWDWAFVGLIDMPFITADSLNRLRQRAQVTTKRILRPALQVADGRVADVPHGHPVGFHCSLFPRLATLRGDEGARKVLQDYVSAIEDVALKDDGVVRDVDRPEDLSDR